MNMQKIKLATLLLIGLFSYSLANADTIKQTQSATEYSATLKERQAEITQQAHQWGIKPDEYRRYQELMNGPLGIYSPGLDALTALGISARSDEERRYYAELQVLAESRRVERELAYQRAYDEAFKRIYPDLLPVDFGLTPKASSTTVLSGNGRLAVFVKDKCLPCEAKVKQLQKAGRSFDLYFIDAQSDAAIRKWATKVGINADKVLERSITLNHDAGRWQAIALGGELPAVVKLVDGKWQRQ